MKRCEKCGEWKEDHFFQDGEICIFCQAEIETLGEPITNNNLGEIIQKRFSESKKEVQHGKNNC